MPASLPISHPDLPLTTQGKRISQLIALDRARLDEYKRHHQAVFPDVLAALRRAHIFDYSIHLYDLPALYPQPILVATMKYLGTDFAADMQSVADDPETKRWWELMDPMQQSFVPQATGSASGPGWWVEGEEVFRLES